MTALLCAGVSSLLCWSVTAKAQEPDGQARAAQRTNARISWSRLHVSYDNDFLNVTGHGTDYGYTAGLSLEAFYGRRLPSGNPLDKLLVALPRSTKLYFYGMASRIFTPTDISYPRITYGDRPYASVLYLSHGLVSVDRDTHAYLSSSLSVGAMGPATGGADLQSWFHQVIGYRKPQGWPYQTSNSLVLDYRLYHERPLLHPNGHFHISGNIDVEAGTLVDNMGLGFTVAAGQLGDFFTRDHALADPAATAVRGWRLQAFLHPEFRLLFYDATLEGGFFTSNKYVLDGHDLEPLYFQGDLGMVVSHGRFRIGFTQKIRTAEFKGGKTHTVGNITFSIPLSGRITHTRFSPDPGTPAPGTHLLH